MKPFKPSEHRDKALYIFAVATVAILVLFLSYLLATQHQLRRINDIFYGTKDSINVSATACKDSLNSIVETASVPSATDEIVAEAIDDILGNIAVLETVTYFLIVLCIIYFVYFILSTVREWLMNRRKSSFDELSAQRAEIITKDLLDPVGLCELIDKRINQAKNKSDKSALFALDYIYLSRTGIIKPRKKSAYQTAFLDPIISNSQFSDKVKEIEEILDDERLPDALDYRGKYSDLKGVFNRFAVIRKNSSPTCIGNSSENGRKSE